VADDTGIRGETVDEILFLDQVEDPPELGFVRLVNGAFKFKDNAGVFNPRTGGSGITADDHKILRQLVHFIESGPAEGFTTGAYCETTGTIKPTAIVWWESSGKLKKIVERLITWTGVNPTTDKWKVYDAADGTTVLWTVIDTISYSGVFETSRTRAIVSGDA
jgi:hypothetical protein